MTPAASTGVILMILGAVAPAHQGITYTTHKEVLDIGPIEATKTEHKTIRLPPVLGGVALVGGIILVIGAGKKDT